jgi:hypothetical protein
MGGADPAHGNVRTTLQALSKQSMANQLRIISFGSDRSYTKMAKSLLKSIKNVYPEVKIRAYNRSDLSPTLRKYAKCYRRGYGYWRWKPWIIAQELRQAREGCILLYLDARFSHTANCRVAWLDRFIQNRECHILCWHTEYIENHWTSSNLFLLLGL